MVDRSLRIVRESARKFRVDFPGGGHSGMAQIREIDHISSDESDDG